MASQSSSSSSSRRMRNYVRGIPTSCAKCGSSIVTRMSRTELNPYQRYYRCAKIASQMNPEENHCFKWIDEAFQDELLDFKHWNIKIENDIEMQKQIKTAVYDIVNGAVTNVKMQMKSLVVIVVVCVILFVGIVKLV